MSLLRKLRRTAGNTSGEMPFFDHLEELRWRIIWSVAALIAGTGIGFYLAMRFDILGLLKRPVDPYLMTGGQLLALAVTDAFFITFKLGLAIGFVLAMPIIAYHIWSFLAPALTRREKRAIVPALYLGLVLFALGVLIAYLYALPMTLRFLYGFQTESLAFALTAGNYFSFVIKLLLAFGVVFELPVVIMILAALGLVTSKFLASKRRHAIAGLGITAALITPGDAITATIFLMGPLIILYEVSILLTKMIERSRMKRAAADSLLEAR